MSIVKLRYLASRDWMESQILAGHAIDRRDQTLSVDLEACEPALAARVEALDDAIVFIGEGEETRVCVLDSGLDPEISFGSNQSDLVPFDEPVIEKIGRFPELPAPTDDVGEVVGAWEAWMQEYIAEAIETMEELTAKPPKVGTFKSGGKARWAGRNIYFGSGLKAEINLDDGLAAIRDARAASLWKWAARSRFSPEALAAAEEATKPQPRSIRMMLKNGEAAELAKCNLEFRKRLFRAAKAYDESRAAAFFDFDEEMARWAVEHGSPRLKLGLEDGYRMNAQYISERIAAEAPGMYAMPSTAAKRGWATKAGSPSESALLLRRRIAAAVERSAPANPEGKPEAQIMVIKKPPPEIYRADQGVYVDDVGVVGTDLPSRDGWPWSVNQFGHPEGSAPIPFEAVVVENWLGRFHLIGAVGDSLDPPKGIWAMPDPDAYAEDGTVLRQDPDLSPPTAAKRKPPDPPQDDDIPF